MEIRVVVQIDLTDRVTRSIRNVFMLLPKFKYHFLDFRTFVVLCFHDRLTNTIPQMLRPDGLVRLIEVKSRTVSIEVTLPAYPRVPA